MTNEELWIETTLCFECGTDTKYDGFVNRVFAGRDLMDCYKCGPCTATHDAISDENGIEQFDDDKWDAYMAQRIKYVDKIFPDAPKFRELMETEYKWSDDDIEKVQKLIRSYQVVRSLA